MNMNNKNFFAAQAMSALINKDDFSSWENLAEKSFNIAAAMEAESNKVTKDEKCKDQRQ